LRNRRALSSVIGIVFSVIALVSVVTYITYGMNSLEKFNQQVLVENTATVNQGDETFDTVKAETVNNKFNITVQNTGSLPISITRLWIQNKTDSSWGTYKYDINIPVSPGEVASNIGQNLDLYTMDTQGYEIKLTTERGSVVEFLINSLTQESLGMKLAPTPDTIPTDFTTTVIYQVVNNSTGKNMLLNLQPQLSTSGTADPTYISGPTPASYPSLARGDTATFVWVYKLTGDDGTSTTFNATLTNAKQGNWATATVTVKTPLSSLHAGTVIETNALASSPLVDGLLLFHNEILLTPGGAYQMYSGDADAGINGSRIELDKTNPRFFTNNGSSASIPAGTWVRSLRLQSEAMPTSLVGEGESMIFHFEDGDNANPYNSQGNATRNLRPGSGVNSTILAVETVSGTAEGAAITAVTTSTSITGITNQLYLASVSVNPNIDVTSVTGLGLTWTQVDQQCGYKGTTRTEVWRALGGATTGTVTATVAANAQGLAISVSRFSGINTVSPIGNVTSSNVNGFESTNCSGSTVTSSYSTSIKTADNNAMVWGAVGKLNYTHTQGSGYSERDDISSGSTATNSAGVATENKTQATAGMTNVTGSFPSSIDWSSIAVEITPSTKCAPDWQAGTGPHGSGAYYFNGIDDCLRSINNVSSVDGIYSEPDTTALWFKTDGQLPPSGEWDLVYWEGPCSSSKCYYYKIYLDNQANVVFSFNTKNSAGQEITTCESTKGYDDNQWYHVVAVRNNTEPDQCILYISYLNGTDSEAAISVTNFYAGESVNADGYWRVGSNKQENANWFKGWIDDVIHWNEKALNATEADDLSRTNYGTGAHKLDLRLDITDQDGNYITNLVNDSAVAVPFFDPKAQDDNYDGTYGTFNTTTALSKISLSANERLNFTINWVPSTTEWKALELDMKIDDENMLPYPSFLQIPQPDATLSGYYTFDNDNEIKVLVTNSGTTGAWFTYQGSRVTFDDLSTTTSYAGIIKRLNGTIVDVNNDSILVPPGYTAEINFTQPKSTPTNSTGTVDLIPPSTYKMYVYLKGYDETGQLFLRTKNIGSVTVIE